VTVVSVLCVRVVVLGVQRRAVFRVEKRLFRRCPRPSGIRPTRDDLVRVARCLGTVRFWVGCRVFPVLWLAAWFKRQFSRPRALPYSRACSLSVRRALHARGKPLPQHRNPSASKPLTKDTASIRRACEMCAMRPGDALRTVQVACTPSPHPAVVLGLCRFNTVVRGGGVAEGTRGRLTRYVTHPLGALHAHNTRVRAGGWAWSRPLGFGAIDEGTPRARGAQRTLREHTRD